MDDPESVESDPEDERQPDNEDLAQMGADGKEEVKVKEEEEEDEECGSEEEQQVTVEEEDWHTCSEDESEEEGTTGSSSESSFHNSSRLLHKDELLDMFKSVHNGPRCKDGQLTVGLVGKKLALYNLPQSCVFYFTWSVAFVLYCVISSILHQKCLFLHGKLNIGSYFTGKN